MPRRVLPGVTHPGGYVAGRDITLEGVTYQLMEVIPSEVVARCKNASVLLSRRWIVPWPDPHDRKGHPLTPKPTHLHHTEVRAHLES